MGAHLIAGLHQDPVRLDLLRQCAVQPAVHHNRLFKFELVS
jgi:hypothetical protein